MSFFQRYPSSGVTTVNGLSGALTLAAGTNVTLDTVGNTITINASGGSSGATTALDNLVSTAINTNLNFADDGTTTKDITGPNTTGTRRTAVISILGGNQTGSRTAGGIVLQGGAASGPSNAGGEIGLFAGTSAGGANGSITLNTSGTGGTRGAIKLQDDSRFTAQVGWVWTYAVADDTGTGTWMPASGGGANTTLSNLGVTSINADLIPAAGNVTNLGSDTKFYDHGYINNIVAGSLLNESSSAIANLGEASLDMVGNLLSTDGTQEIGDASGHSFAVAYISNSIVDPATNSAAMAINARELWAIDGSISLDFDQRQLLGPDGTTVQFDWFNMVINSASGNRAIDVENRALNDNAGLQIFYWSNKLGVAGFVPPPTTAADTGDKYDVAVDSNFLYVCIATDTWKRVALASW